MLIFINMFSPRCRAAVWGLLLLSLHALAHAEDDNHDALVAQTASTLASADYARKNCPNLQVDEAALSKLIQRTGSGADALRKNADYIEQRDVLRDMAQGKQAALICVVLPSAHGGYGRDIINEK